jgi:hypothetical protein
MAPSKCCALGLVLLASSSALGASPFLAAQYELELTRFTDVFPLRQRLAKEPLLLETGAEAFFAAGFSSANVFPYRLSKVEDACSVLLRFSDGKTFVTPTHTFPGKLNVIPYSDKSAAEDASGNIRGGDAVVAQYFPPGSIGFAIKHHRPSSRFVDFGAAVPAPGTMEEIKLQDTHIQIVMGVESSGTPRVITVNNPQDYQDGGFGDAKIPGDYPMIFCRPSFPERLPADVQRMFVENIRTMAIAFNTVSVFPERYNGGDPLAAKSPQKVGEHVRMMIKAVAGDSEARHFFDREENQMYCAELAFVASSAGVLFPLNWNTIRQLGVSENEWKKFRAEVRTHNAHDPARPSFFLSNNLNKRIADVRLAELEEIAQLKPINQYPGSKADKNALAFAPMSVADILESFLRVYLPRKELGENVAPYQAEMLKVTKAGLIQMMDVKARTPQARAALALVDEFIAVIGKQYDSYEVFRNAVNPLLARARQLSGPLEASGQGLFTPPSLFHLVLNGSHTGGQIGLEYVGHGFHFSLVQPKN